MLDESIQVAHVQQEPSTLVDLHHRDLSPADQSTKLPRADAEICRRLLRLQQASTDDGAILHCLTQLRSSYVNKMLVQLIVNTWLINAMFDAAD